MRFGRVRTGLPIFASSFLIYNALAYRAGPASAQTPPLTTAHHDKKAQIPGAHECNCESHTVSIESAKWIAVIRRL
jgi:hypothetical protein